jgi:predicted deacylase
MPTPFSKKITVAIFALVAIGVLAFLFVYINKQDTSPALPAKQKIQKYKTEIIGKSVEGRNIEAVTFGDGGTRLMFVGGMHGGYEYNSVLLAYKFIDYLKANPAVVPSGLSVTIVPSANPDGLYKVTGKVGRFSVADVSENTKEGLGRFNANDVDLNRNFDCKWKSKSMWKGNVVSAGTAPFSEPEAVAIRDFVLKYNPAAVVFWHSQANAVYSSECEGGILPETTDIMNAYSRAAGYTPVDSFDAYEITGDAEGWLASINVPAITVELKTHKTVEWEKNLSGAKALFEYYAQKRGL